MSTATTTDTGQTISRRTTSPSSTTPATQTERSAANRLRSTFVPVRLRAMVANDFTRIEQAVGDLLVDRPRRNILRRAGAGSGGAA